MQHTATAPLRRQQAPHEAPPPPRARSPAAPPRASAAGAAARVVATREAGKNEKLISGLAAHGVSCLELPLIEHAPGPDRCGCMRVTDAHARVTGACMRRMGTPQRMPRQPERMT